MASLLKTVLLQLNKWAGADKPEYADFLADNEKIEAYAVSVNASLASILADIATAEASLATLTADIATKQASISGAASTVTGSNLTPGKIVISNQDGKIVSSATDSSKLTFLNKVYMDVMDAIDALSNTVRVKLGTTETAADTNKIKGISVFYQGLGPAASYAPGIWFQDAASGLTIYTNNGNGVWVRLN